jgi:hypothetical protein
MSKKLYHSDIKKPVARNTLAAAIERLQTTSNLDTLNKGYEELWNMLIAKGQDVSQNVAENILTSLK